MPVSHRGPINARALGVLLPAVLAAACSTDATGNVAADSGADAQVTDAGAKDVGTPDSGAADVGVDSGTADVGVDGGPADVGVDAGTEDVGVDAGTADVGVDSGTVDVGVDSGPADVGVDAGFDVGFDVGFDAGFDAGFDVGFDAGPPDVGCAVGVLCGGACVDTSVDPRHCGDCSTVCPASSVCIAGACAATSCSSLHAAAPSLPSGAYLLDSDGVGPLAPFRAYCDMTNDGGGWTLALKIDGTLPTFLYAAPLWTSDATLNPTLADLTTNEAKFDSFSQIAFTNVRLVMRQLAPVVAGATDRAVVIPAAATSLRAAVASAGTAVTTGPLATSTTGLATTATRDAWRSLFESSGIQCNCGAQGFNVSANQSMRLGFFGNQENDCNSSDSNAGIGHTLYSSGNNAIGTWACGGDYTGDRATRTFSWVFVR